MEDLIILVGGVVPCYVELQVADYIRTVLDLNLPNPTYPGGDWSALPECSPGTKDRFIKLIAESRMDQS